MKTIIIGAGSFGKEILAIIKDFNSVADNEFIGYLDDDLTKNHVLGPIKNHKVIRDVDYICAIANPKIKLSIPEFRCVFIHYNSSVAFYQSF